MFRRHERRCVEGWAVYFLPAQINTVDSDTKLVTLTVGGNDVLYVGSLTAWACANDPSHVPFLARTSSVLPECVVAHLLIASSRVFRYCQTTSGPSSKR
jgi:hypothetical protein